MTQFPDFSSFTAADSTELAHRDALQLLTQQAGCTQRSNFQPGHFTASAFVLSSDRTSLLLIEHSKLARWLQPGGHVEASDIDLEAAARREVAEETDLTNLELLQPAPFDLDVHTIPARKTEPEHQHFDVRFLFRARTSKLQAGSDALDARWVRLEDVFTMESDESVWRAVRKILAQNATRKSLKPA